ncbi:DUF6438 domain-containing protein [Leptolyngbya sp. KIOST-1]|uniref:DUF6438 domain-containing protein n=1 Tax=Leptolyngbya sp. KIOST-1 TaxID=1229172 RepID=UPI0012E0AA6D|nr:DUF6438 domain-containing protein [Leptolyngbya sp. KIOST-1]
MEQDVPSIAQVILERGMCFGECPVYKVTLLANGTVTWLGELFVKTTGPASWLVPTTRVTDIEKALHQANFRSLADLYEPDMTCQPSCKITVEYADGLFKTVDHDLGSSSAPKALVLLEKQLDKLIGTAPYIGTLSR